MDKFLDKTMYTGDCIVWIAGLTTNGYGKFKYNNRTYRAHRFAWEIAYGPIPQDLVIDHLCRNIVCVNPAHLRAVTQRENIFATGSLSPIKKQAEQMVCKRGHTLTLSKGKKGRICRMCVRRKEAYAKTVNKPFPIWSP